MVEPNQLKEWRRELQELHESIVKGRDQFEAWFEETALIEADIDIETDDLRQCIVDIKKDKQRYREILCQIPEPAELSAEEVHKRNGKASTLLDLAAEIAVMEIHLPRKIEKMCFLLKHPSQ